MLDANEAAVMARCAQDGIGNSPPQLRLAQTSWRLSRTSRLGTTAAGTAFGLAAGRFPRGRANDRHRRGLRRHDHRPRLPARPLAGTRDGRTVRVCRDAVRSRVGAAIRANSTQDDPAAAAPRGGRPLAAIARLDESVIPAGISTASPRRETQPAVDALFQAKLLDNMYDAVVFIDAAGRMVLWNHGAERLTGIAGTASASSRGIPDCWALPTKKAVRRRDAIAPCITALRSGVQSLRRMTICGRQQRRVAVDTPRHAGRRPGRHDARRHPAAARRLVGNLAGTTLPEPARKSHQGSADPGRQPGRVRPRPRDVRRRPPAATSCRAA